MTAFAVARANLHSPSEKIPGYAQATLLGDDENLEGSAYSAP